MDKPRRNLETRKAYLKLLGNPYASLQVENVAKQEDALDAQQQPYVRHPYAYVPQEEDDATVNLVAQQPTSFITGSLSKAEFRNRCRRIFEQYIPALEKSRIRPQHRDFIVRNESRSPAARFLLAKELEKYDLSTITGLTTHFNRERDSLTEDKLRLIERLVGDEI